MRSFQGSSRPIKVNFGWGRVGGGGFGAKWIFALTAEMQESEPRDSDFYFKHKRCTVLFSFSDVKNPQSQFSIEMQCSVQFIVKFECPPTQNHQL